MVGKKWFLNIPHYVLVFKKRPDNYKLILISKKGRTKYLKGDPFMLDIKGVLVQKRDIFLYSCIFNPIKNVRFFLIKVN